jgi:hypothetical protein
MFKELLYNLNIIKKEHYFRPFVYIGNSLKPTNHITDKIKWLDDVITIKCYKKELVDKISKIEDEKYFVKYPFFVRWWKYDKLK